VPFTGFADLDADGYGGEAVESCEPLSVVDRGGDCADDDPTRSPAATEVCDDADVDDDCDGEGDESGAVGESEWYPDVDGDGWGAGTSLDATLACDAPDGYVETPGDCDDGNSALYPGAPEAPDGLDNDCDGFTEDEDPDGDGLSTEYELVAGCDPHEPDTDSDGRWDGEEAVLEDGAPRDSDKDGVPDCADTDRGCGCGAGGAVAPAGILLALWALRRRVGRGAPRLSYCVSNAGSSTARDVHSGGARRGLHREGVPPGISTK
jgi:hypothetical protein